MRYKHATKLQHKETDGQKETSPQLSFFFHLDSQYNIIKIENAMDININGNPGTGNTFTEIHVQHADNVNPNATTVTVTHHHYGEGQVAPKAKATGGDTNVDTALIRTEILNYVDRLRPQLNGEWKHGYTKLWEGILDLGIVADSIYKPGKQQRTNFNRSLVGNIIHYLDRYGLYKNAYNATALAIALENDEGHTVRMALGKDPLDGHIVSRLDRYMETLTLDRKNLPSKLDID